MRCFTGYRFCFRETPLFPRRSAAPVGRPSAALAGHRSESTRGCRPRLLHAAAFLILAMAARTLAAPSLAAPWQLIWADEFDGAAGLPPDSTKWAFDLGHNGWGNKELEDYTNNPGNVSLDGDGHLVIRAARTVRGQYTSGRIKTAGLFEIHTGKIEARIKIPSGQGIWAAFWMLGSDILRGKRWPKCGEIDIMENIGREPHMIHGTIHGPGYAGKHGISSWVDVPAPTRFADDFHVYGVEWSPIAIDFYLDGVSYARVTPALLPRGAPWVFDHPFFLLLNVAVGGKWPRNPDRTTIFPQSMQVDWVRVWQSAR
jgi:beta-glucanase (GH16 family)